MSGAVGEGGGKGVTGLGGVSGGGEEADISDKVFLGC